MDLNSERALLIKELQQVEDISLLRAIKAVLHYGLQNEGIISVEQYNKEIEEAEARIDSGNFVVHEDAVNRIKKWRIKED
jgi:predicted transcriptional regulator